MLYTAVAFRLYDHAKFPPGCDLPYTQLKVRNRQKKRVPMWSAVIPCFIPITWGLDPCEMLQLYKTWI